MWGGGDSGIAHNTKIERFSVRIPSIGPDVLGFGTQPHYETPGKLLVGHVIVL